jgi:hypothetical protein
MPDVDALNPTDLDRIHIRRMNHANFALFLDLLRLDIPEVDGVLAHWGITLLPHRRVGIEYGPGEKQTLEKELIAANKAKAAAARPKKKKKAKKR